MDEQELSKQLRQATRHRAGERLRASVHTQLALQAAAREAGESPWAPRRPWTLVLAGFAGGVVVSAAVALWGPRLTTVEPGAAELVAAHVRALREGPLIQVASDDRHTVKPWFQGRVDFAPPVPDLAEDGFTLLGGRVDAVSGHAVAALTYQRRLHMVQVFTWPASAPGLVVSEQWRGFSVQHWSDGMLQTWVVADMDGAELDCFARAWRARSSGSPP